MKKVIVIGGGAAGMMAAVAAARKGNQVVIYEKNEKLGKKLFITGKGRCNVTNACDSETMFRSVVSNSKFLFSAFYGFGSSDVMKLLEENGCRLKIERGGRVFPETDKSSDVITAFSKCLNNLGVEIRLGEPVDSFLLEDGKVDGVVLGKGLRKVRGDAVVVACGGLSYPSTGSTGDGYRLAKSIGHTVTKLRPALVPFQVEEKDTARELMGLSLKNIEITVTQGKKELYRDFGEMLFTHFGVSGPVILSASSFAAKALEKGPLLLAIDLKPALSREQLDLRILRDFEEAKNKQFKNALDRLFPSKLIPVMIGRSGISPEKKVNEITKGERQSLAEQTKRFLLTVTDTRDYSEAIITQGGIAVKEINPATMESKKTPGVYFVGEALDLDGVTGGFNLQIAWSTGFAAGNSI